MKRGTPDHPKVYEFCALLKIRRPMALGYLELLFHFTAQYAPRGDIGRYSDKRIAAALDFPGKPEVLMEALVKSGWVDLAEEPTRFLVHDWSEHADRAVLQRLSRQGKTPLKQNHIVTGKLCTLPEPVPEPVPEPATESAAEQQPAAKPANTETDLADALIKYVSDTWPLDRNGACRIVNACRNVKADLTMEDIRFAVKRAYKPEQRGPMLFETTLPAELKAAKKRYG